MSYKNILSQTAGVVYGRFAQLPKAVFVHMRRYEKSPAKAGLFKNIFWFLYTENHRRDAEINKEGKRVDNRCDKRTCHNGGVKVEPFCQNGQRTADELRQNNG